MTLSSFRLWRHHSAIILFLALLALCCSSCSAAALEQDPRSLQQQQQEYELYSLKPFSVQVTSSSSSSSITPDATSLNIASLGRTVKAVTQEFLKEFIHVSLLHDASPIDAKVEGVSLEVSVKRSSQKRTRLYTNDNGGGSSSSSIIITAELYGDVAFASVETMPDRDTVETFLESLLEKAFAPPSLGLYQERLMATDEPHLQTLTSMVVTTDFENRKPSTGSSSSGVDTNATPPKKKSTWKAALTSILLVLLLVVFLAVLFVRMRLHSKRFYEKDHYVDSEHGTAVTSRDSPNSQHHHHDVFYASHNLACMAEQGGGMHHVSFRREHTKSSHYPQDEYEQQQEPSLLSRFYQATFAGSNTTEATVDSHSTSSMERHAIHNPRSYSVRHEEEEEDVVDHHIHRSGPYVEREGGTLASWVKSISAPFTNSPSHQQQEEQELQFMHDGPNKDKPFVYRDFPRHDGTPCLIYNSPFVAEQQRKSMGKSGDLNSTVWAATSPKNSNDQDEEEEEEPVDSFVDRLEQLMVVRHEQYQERCNMEWQKRRRSMSSGGGGGVISVQEAEAALEDFLDISESDGGPAKAMVSPTEASTPTLTPPKLTRTSSLSYENVLTDEKNIDEAIRSQHRARVSWDEEDPTITSGGILS